MKKEKGISNVFKLIIYCFVILREKSSDKFKMTIRRDNLRSEDIGFLAVKTPEGFSVWNRKEKAFHLVPRLPEEQEDNTIKHIKDLYQIMRAQGLKKAISYACGASDAYWNKVNSQGRVTGIRTV
jgi:hypothetical protein